jgi:chemotaxis signal transduction protein
VTNVRGEILSVTDPAILMSLGRIVGPEDAQPPAVVVTNGLVATAIVVDEIGDIVEVAKSALEPPVSIIDRAQVEFVAGSMFIDGLMVGVLNVERVLEPVGISNRH